MTGTDDEADALAVIRETYVRNARRAADYLGGRLLDVHRSLDAGATPAQARWVGAAWDLASSIQVLGLLDEIEHRRRKPAAGGNR
jgi:hypothetical protein